MALIIVSTVTCNLQTVLPINTRSVVVAVTGNHFTTVAALKREKIRINYVASTRWYPVSLMDLHSRKDIYQVILTVLHTRGVSYQ
jgi:hypothetical protein